ncbi:MAG: two-component system response regulator [Lentisphaerae bacterium GWF2_44_16]|nr:MAG: two-component system response regulator [Lentisphaerae bacterium GWF2_44_16]
MKKFPEFPILLVDDEPNALLSTSVALASSGINNTVQCEDCRTCLDKIRSLNSKIILLDLNMPGKNGIELLSEIKKDFPETAVIVITAADNVNTAVECMKKGASDYIVKPVDRNRLVTCVKNTIDLYELLRENLMMQHHFLDDKVDNPQAFASIITGSPKMKNIFQYCEAIAPSRQAVLITGETGTGKELIANSIHKLSARSGKFIPVNLAGLDANMFSDTLFGHIKGSFTGASANRKGLVEEAAEGTLFLDEIGDLNDETQIKLLRLLQEREYVPIGSDTIKKSDARIVAATNKDIKGSSLKSQFRKDLFFRLQTHHIKLPPLRERPEDIPYLLDFFLCEAAEEFGKKTPSYPKELVTLLKTYHFPGNIRELRAMVFDAISNHKSMMLSMDTFLRRIKTERTESISVSDTEKDMEIIFPQNLPTIREITEKLMTEALSRANGNQSIAAEILGISQQALSKRLKKNKENSL